jgi:DNA helicase-2/ATP-dependent DNA helicase PcrA
MEQFELALRLLANPRDRLHLGMLVRAWGIEISDSDLDEQSKADPLLILESLGKNAKRGCATTVLGAVKAIQWTGTNFKFLGGLLKIEEFAKSLPEEERALVLQDTREWKKYWDYYIRSEPGGQHSTTSFLGQVALGTTQQPKEDGLALLTVHSAKGMEFDVVFVIGMTEGTFPDYRAKGAALDEESRSAFVAITRSKRLLYLTYPKIRIMPWGDARAQNPSRYLTEIFANQ